MFLITTHNQRDSLIIVTSTLQLLHTNPLPLREIIGIGGGFLCEIEAIFCIFLIIIFMEFYQQEC